MLRTVLLRLLLVLAPFVVYWLWAAWARRRGREVGATPWAWLLAAGALLAGVSLIATSVFHSDNRDLVYRPAETLPDGRVVPGGFEEKR